MQVKQIYSIVNDTVKEVIGDSAILQEDLSNIVDIGKQVFDASALDKYVNKLVNRIGKVVFVDRKYTGSAPSVLMDSWEFGSVLEKISCDLPVATENESWNLQNGAEYKTDIFYQPSVSAKFFNSKVTFEIPLSFTELQIKQSFTSATELNGFLTMLYNAVDKALTIRIDNLIMRTINNMIGETLSVDLTSGDTIDYTNTGIKAVNLLKLYNVTFGTSLTYDKLLTNQAFLRFASHTINTYIDRLSKISTLFNIGGKERFTSKDYLHTVLLSDFVNATKSYLEADTFNKELVSLPNGVETVPYWQGSGESYAFDDVSSINVKTTTEDVIECKGILGVMFDRESLGVSNLDRRVTSNYNPKAEFYTNFYKFDSSYFNDFNENFVVFFVG